MLPSEAPMPPCAATVWERVGKTLDSTATFRPASASCSEARMPEPPAPTMTTSNLRRETVFISDSPEYLQGPAGAAHQPRHGHGLQHQAPAGGLDVVHVDVAHADPGMPGDGDDHREGQHLHPLRREDAGPPGVAH